MNKDLDIYKSKPIDSNNLTKKEAVALINAGADEILTKVEDLLMAHDDGVELYPGHDDEECFQYYDGPTPDHLKASLAIGRFNGAAIKIFNGGEMDEKHTAYSNRNRLADALNAAEYALGDQMPDISIIIKTLNIKVGKTIDISPSR